MPETTLLEKPASATEDRVSLDVLPHAFGPVLIIAMLTLVAFLIVRLIGNPARATDSLVTYEIKNVGDKGLTLEKLFEHKLKDYKDNIEAFNTNLKLQAFFTVVTLLLILRRSHSLEVFGNKVPLRWLHVFVPAVMLYLWLSFGFLLDDLIETRIRGVQMIEKLSAANDTLAKSLMHDSQFIDGWTMTFVDGQPKGNDVGDYSGISHNSQAGTALFLVCVLGIWVAAAHASILAIVAVGVRRYWIGPENHRRIFYYALPLLPFLFFVLSHYQFAYGGHNRNWMQVFIAVVTIIFMLLLLLLSLRVDRQKEVLTLLCLKRNRSISLQMANRGFDDNMPDLRIALIGDSLSTGFHVGRFHGMLQRMWFAWRGNWFIGNAKGEPPIEGIVERITAYMPVRARNSASSTAKIILCGRRKAADWLTNTFHFQHQVDELVGELFPDLLLVWIGHNQIDWVAQRPSSLSQIAKTFVANYHVQLKRLLRMTKNCEKPVSIIVFGLVNFDSFFKARKEAESMRKADVKLFPFLERDYRFFKSMKAEYQEGMIELANRCNTDLRCCCEELANETGDHVKIIYSSAMADTNINSASFLHKQDAWHPSRIGHQALADAAWPVIEQQLERFLHAYSIQRVCS